MCNSYRIKPKQGAAKGVAGRVADVIGKLPSLLVRKSDPGIVVLAEERVEIMRWGFHRSFNPSINNARSDKLESGMWAEAFRERRCVIPMSLFYEWGPGVGGRKQAHEFRDGRPESAQPPPCGSGRVGRFRLNMIESSPFCKEMKSHFPRLAVASLLAACIASSVGCYPAYNYGSAYNQGSKGYAVPREPMPQRQPGHVGVDPGLAIAGVAAAGLLGYAIGENQGYHNHGYYGGGYYRPVPYRRGYYAPRYYR